MEGIHPVNDPQAERDLKQLRASVKHALDLLRGPALCLQGTVEAAYLSLAKAIGQDTDLQSTPVPPREWTDYVGE